MDATPPLRPGRRSAPLVLFVARAVSFRDPKTSPRESASRAGPTRACSLPALAGCIVLRQRTSGLTEERGVKRVPAWDDRDPDLGDRDAVRHGEQAANAFRAARGLPRGSPAGRV